MIKDRDGNEWVLVPRPATNDMIKAFRETAITTDKGSIIGVQSAIAAAIAAAPQFIAPEVGDAMCERVGEIFAAKRHGNTYHERGHAMIAAVRSELGQTLGMVPMREPSDAEFARIAREFYGDIPVCAPHIAGAHMFDAVSKWLKGEL